MTHSQSCELLIIAVLTYFPNSVEPVLNAKAKSFWQKEKGGWKNILFYKPERTTWMIRFRLDFSSRWEALKFMPQSEILKGLIRRDSTKAIALSARIWHQIANSVLLWLNYASEQSVSLIYITALVHCSPLGTEYRPSKRPHCCPTEFYMQIIQESSLNLLAFYGANNLLLVFHIKHWTKIFRGRPISEHS